MNLYSVRPVETSFGALESRYDLFTTLHSGENETYLLKLVLNVTGPIL